MLQKKDSARLIKRATTIILIGETFVCCKSTNNGI